MPQTLTEKVMEKLGLKANPAPDPDDVLAQQLADLISGKTTSEPEPKPNDPKPNSDPNPAEPPANVEALAKALTEMRVRGHGQQVEELASSVRSLTEERNQLRAAVLLAEAQSTVKRLSEGPGWVLPIPAQERLMKVLLTANGESRKEVIELFEGLHGTGLVELKERGVAPTELDLTRFADDPVAMFGSKVERLVAEKKLSETDAMRQVAREDPNLYTAYRRAVDLKRVS